MTESSEHPLVSPWQVVGAALAASGAAREDCADSVWGVLALGALVLFLANSLLHVLRPRTRP